VLRLARGAGAPQGVGVSAGAGGTARVASGADGAAGAAALLLAVVLVTLVGSRSPCSPIVSNLHDTWP
jgi:hypothetical protein